MTASERPAQAGQREGWTPGPWRILHVDGSRWPIAAPDFPGGGIVAEVNVCRGGIEEVAANARLIAAAPDLADALAGLLVWFGPPLTGADSAAERELAGAIAAARAALSKAGRQEP